MSHYLEFRLAGFSFLQNARKKIFHFAVGAPASKIPDVFFRRKRKKIPFRSCISYTKRITFVIQKAGELKINLVLFG